MYKINEHDNVGVALRDIARAEVLSYGEASCTAQEKVLAGHKIALQDIADGEAVIKYGFSIGVATKQIEKGSWVHSHNMKSCLGSILEYQYKPKLPEQITGEKYEFMGYKRDNGKVGIRNEVWIIPTVGCVNSIARTIECRSQEFVGGNIDGIYAYNHPHGCSQLGDDQLYTQKILSGLINHPNAAGILVIGLGCENNQIDLLKKVIGKYNERLVKFIVCQAYEDEIAVGVAAVKEICQVAAKFTRTSQNLNKLVIGLKCGGSDGLSGITANPLTGMIANKVIAAGGTAILTEVPEMFGAETLLMNRCRDYKIFVKTVQLINNFKKYFLRYGEKIDENPSPGNKAGGITTLEDKSFGCIQKGGNAIIEDVLDYGESVIKNGLNLLQAPGNDLVAVTALAASGAQMILFTTGRGTPLACPVPTIKIASNSKLATFKKNWIDFNAGVLLEGKNINSATDDFMSLIIAVASGSIISKSESIDKHELAIFKDGVTL